MNFHGLIAKNKSKYRVKLKFFVVYVEDNSQKV